MSDARIANFSRCPCRPCNPPGRRDRRCAVSSWTDAVDRCLCAITCATSFPVTVAEACTLPAARVLLLLVPMLPLPLSAPLSFKKPGKATRKGSKQCRKVGGGWMEPPGALRRAVRLCAGRPGRGSRRGLGKKPCSTPGLGTWAGKPKKRWDRRRREQDYDR